MSGLDEDTTKKFLCLEQFLESCNTGDWRRIGEARMIALSIFLYDFATAKEYYDLKWLKSKALEVRSLTGQRLRTGSSQEVLARLFGYHTYASLLMYTYKNGTFKNLRYGRINPAAIFVWSNEAKAQGLKVIKTHLL